MLWINQHEKSILLHYVVWNLVDINVSQGIKNNIITYLKTYCINKQAEHYLSKLSATISAPELVTKEEEGGS